MIVSADEIVAHAAKAAFGHARVTNVFRAILVEAIIDKALPVEWSWCSSDYASCDFRHEDGTRLEVKQSAALQSWQTAKPSAPIFDIAPRTGYWLNGVEWFEKFELLDASSCKFDTLAETIEKTRGGAKTYWGRNEGVE